MNLPFENKVALVTGAGSGMRLATARAFAETGAAVFWLCSPVASFVISTPSLSMAVTRHDKYES